MRATALVRTLGIASLCVATPCAAADNIEDAIRLAPADAWILDYADHSCSLNREFSDGQRSVMLKLEQRFPGDLYQIAFGSRNLTLTGEDPTVWLLPDSNGSEIPIGGRGERDGIEAITIVRSLRRTADLESVTGWDAAMREKREGEIEGVAVTNAFSSPFLLQTGSLSAPLQAMEHCLVDLMNGLGLDGPEQLKLTRPASRMNYERWVRRVVGEGAPRNLVVRGVNAIVPINLIIDEHGQVTHCSGRAFREFPRLVDDTCASVSKHAQYEPAMDSRGNPIASHDSFSVVYRVDGGRDWAE